MWRDFNLVNSFTLECSFCGPTKGEYTGCHFNPTLYETEMADRFTGGNEDVVNMFAKMVNPSQRVGTSDELASIVSSFVQGKLPYKSGDVFVADADTHASFHFGGGEATNEDFLPLERVDDLGGVSVLCRDKIARLI